MNNLTTPENIRSNVRPVSQHLDDDRILIYIRESEQLNIKPRIGDALFIDLTKYVNSSDTSGFPDEYEILLNGGEYKDGEKTFVGLVEALNYYVYARLVKNNSETVTRFGVVQKEDEYSSNVELKKQLVAEKDALSVADKYMADCIEYLNSIDIPKFKKAGKARNRLRISIIGN